MEDMHRLLARQLKKHGAAECLADEFLRSIDAAYRQADDDRVLLERSLDLTSQEMLRDLDELRRAKEALSESRSFLEKAQEAARIGSWVTSLDGSEPALWSKECFRIFGVEPGEPLDFEGILALVHPDDREPFQRMRAAAIRGEAPFAFEYRIKRADGAARWLNARADVVRDKAGAAVKMIGVVQDVTERRELEDRLRQSLKMEAVGRLAGGVAHDFNNILTAIKGYSSFLKMSVGKESPLFGDVDEIEKAADRAAALTHQLLAFSRKQVLQPEILDVNAAISGLETMMRCLIREDIKLITRLKPVLGRVKADPGQVAQVLMNLIVNGRDAMPGGGRLVIETDDVAAGDGPLGVPAVSVSVADEGVGMDSETRAHVFEPFFTTKEHGTGLGLATVYGIVSQSGGTVEVESVPGRGTKFTLYFPRHDGDAGPAASAPSGAAARHGTETILVVEDEEVVRSMIGRALRELGYDVLVAARGEEALRLFDAHAGSIHAVVTDIIMPGMNGRALAEILSARKPGIRVLYMSGYTDDVIAVHGVLEPGTPFLQKPFTPGSFVAKLREILDAAP